MTLTLTFNPLQTMVMTHSRTKAQGQRSVSSEDKMDRRTEVIALPSWLMWLINRNKQRLDNSESILTVTKFVVS